MDGFARAGAEDIAGAGPGAPVDAAGRRASRGPGSPARLGPGAGRGDRDLDRRDDPAGADAVVRVEDTALRDGRVEVEAEVEPGTQHPPRRRGHRRRARRCSRPGARAGPRRARRARLGRPVAGPLRPPARASRCWPPATSCSAPGAPARPGRRPRHQRATRSRRWRGAAGPRWSASATGRRRSRGDAGGDRRARSTADVAVICGGVSVGEHDHVKAGARRARRRAGLLGRGAEAGQAHLVRRRRGETLVFGLPGNPVSAMVTFLLLVRPALRAMLGGARAGADADDGDPRRATTRSRPAAPTRSAARSSCARTAGTRRRPAHQGSHVLTSMLGADAWRSIPTRGGSRAGRGARSRSSCSKRTARLASSAMTVTCGSSRSCASAPGSDRSRSSCDEGATVADALERLGSRPAARRAARADAGAMAVNREYADPRHAAARRRRAGADPAGQRRRRARGARRASPTSRSRLERARPRRVGRPGAGAIVIFQGVTREVERARLRGLPRDGRASGSPRSSRVRRAPRALSRGRRAPGRPGPAGRAERDRRRLRRPPRGSVRRRPRGDRPDQGRGADLEARGRGRRRGALGRRGRCARDGRTAERTP